MTLAKGERNRRERGFGFDFAALILEGHTIGWPDDRTDYDEARVRAIGGVRRIISARLADRKEGTEPMAREPMTLEQIRAKRLTADAAKIGATTEADIRRQQIEDGEDPDAPLPPFRPTPNVSASPTLDLC